MISNIRKYVRQVRRNPHLFCYNTCCISDCPKHKERFVGEIGPGFEAEFINGNYCKSKVSLLPAE